MDFEIKPLKSAGPIELGMTQSEARRVLGGAFRTFRRDPAALYPSDYYSEDGVFLYYNREGRVEAVEFSEPSCPLLYGVCLIGMELKPAKNFLTTLTSDLVEDNDGAVSRRLGLSIYSPLLKENPMTPVEGVLVFGSDYFKATE